MIPPRNSRQAPEAGPSDVADPQGFGAQFRCAYPRLTLVAAGVTGDRQSAEDIVQEAAIIALGKIDQFSPGSNFSAWLAEIVRRCALNYRRKTKLRRTYAADPAILNDVNSRTGPTDEPTPLAPASGEILADQEAFDDELLSALQQLSAEARSCLLLRTIEKMSYAEIASLMSIPEGTAMSHVHRSKSALRRLLAHAAMAEGRATESP